jgi:hypothetical protein
MTWTVAVTVEVPGLVGGGAAQAAVRFVVVAGAEATGGETGPAGSHPEACSGAALAANRMPKALRGTRSQCEGFPLYFRCL